MQTLRAVLRVLIAVGAFCLIAACDDDKKEDVYKVTVYVSKNIELDVIEGEPVRKRNKPQVAVIYPDGVEVETIEKETKKGTIHKFVPITLLAIILLLLAAAWRSGCVHPPRPILQV